jgi:hypothetical protein
MHKFVEDAAMMCLQQEIVPWGKSWPLTIDCISTIVSTPGFIDLLCLALSLHPVNSGVVNS